MGIERPQVSDLDRHGYPEGTKSPTTIDWYSYNTQIVNGTTQVTWHHYEVYVVPVDFTISFTVLPLTSGSWGAFEGVDLWFKMNTNVWLDAFTQNQMFQAQDAVGNGTSVTAADYRGAFPIWAWVEQWDPYTVTDQNNNTASIPSEMSAYTDITPSFGGREVSLYEQPSWVSAQPVDIDSHNAQAALGQRVGNIGDRSKVAYYIPITLGKFGGLYQGGGNWFWSWSNYYYPSASLRIRVLYAVWGEWVYLWTAQEAANQGYQWQNRSSMTINNPSWWDQLMGSLSGWLSNPFNQLWLILIIGAVVVIVVSIASPGVWTAVAQSRKKT
jgi:hypothetical protein